MKKKRFALFLLIFAIGIAVPLMTGGGCKKDDKKKDQQAAIAIMIADHNAKAAADADPHEPDNSYGQADAQGFFPPTTAFNGTMWNSDIFAINVPSGQLNLIIDCIFTVADGDIDMWLDNSSYDELASAESTTDNETINITVPTPGTYYIWVRQISWLPNGQLYQLGWTCY